MVTLFDNYEQQYSVLTADITAQIGSLAASNTSKFSLFASLRLPKNYVSISKFSRRS